MIDTTLPLTDIHRHLDGNIRPQTILELGRQYNISLPAQSLETLIPHVQVIANEPDLVSFLLGCSFSFEHALIDAGIELRHVSQGKNVAMYRTNLQTVPAGPFHGPMVVSMRPMKAADAIRAVQVTARVPAVHGAPVHLGDPSLIGIADINRPDFGEPVEILPDELPVFWACGVTPQAVVMAAAPEFCITHAPGYMLVTDLLNSDLALA